MSVFRSLSSDRRPTGDSRAWIFVVAVLLSILAHLVFALYAGESFIPSLPGVSAPGESGWEQFVRRAKSVFTATVDEEELKRDLDSARAETDPGEPVSLQVGENLSRLESSAIDVLFDPPPPSGNALDAGLPTPEAADAPLEEAAWQPREQVIEIASRFANDDAVALPRRIVPDLDALAAEPALGVGPITTIVARALEVRDFTYSTPTPEHETVREPESVAEAVTLQPPPEPTVDVESVGREAAAYFAEQPAEVASASPIDDVLVSSIRTYRPTFSDGYLYFEVLVERKSESVLPPVPRDVLFVQDASDSIGEECLAQCKRALSDMITSALRAGDRFNVLSFDTRTRTAFPEAWRVATPEAIREGCAFVDGLTASGKTDLYNAFDKALRDLVVEPGRATIVFLLSDGIATAGDIQRDSDLIAHFSTRNDGAVSLFGFGVSKRSDEYLLSMMSYCNRGGAAEIASGRSSVAREATRMFSGILSPVLTDIRFSFDAEARAVVTPTKITSLYLERPLTLYGRVPEGTKDVTFRAVGENAGRAYDLVFTHELKASSGSANADIAKNWARTRLYDLYARQSKDPDPQVLAEIKRLSTTYGVQSPFRVPTARAPSHAH